MQCKEYEKSDKNFIHSLSLLYAGGVISKVKYQQTRLSLVMKNTGRHTKKGLMSKERITYGWGIPVPKPLPYSALINKIEELDMGDVISARDTLCHDLPVDQRVDGVYRNLENFLLMLCKFYFETDKYRKDSDKLKWFGEREGTFKAAIGGDGAPFGKWDQSMSWLTLNIPTTHMCRNTRHYNEQLWGIVGAWALVFHFNLVYMKYILRQRKKLAI